MGGVELTRLKGLPLTDLGRRILVQWALVSPNGDTGPAALAKLIGLQERTLWRILKEPEPGWSVGPTYLTAVARLCTLLHVDPSWLLDTVYLEPEPPTLAFELRKRRDGLEGKCTTNSNRDTVSTPTK